MFVCLFVCLFFVCLFVLFCLFLLFFVLFLYQLAMYFYSFCTRYVLLQSLYSFFYNLCTNFVCVLFAVANVLLAAPYFFCPGRSMNKHFCDGARAVSAPPPSPCKGRSGIDVCRPLALTVMMMVMMMTAMTIMMMNRRKRKIKSRRTWGYV